MAAVPGLAGAFVANIKSIREHGRRLSWELNPRGHSYNEMANSSTVDQVQAALAAFLAGKKTLAELETVLGAALQSGLWTPAVVMDVLRDVIGSGRVPPEALRRLGLCEANDATIARAVETSSESVDPAIVRASPQQPISTGQLLAGRYRLDRKLGEGGMGVVYQASDQEVEGETFAIKVLSPEIRERSEALELLREEVRKTRLLAHPNIVGVYSLNVDRTAVFILMECLEGKTLQALLDEDFGRGMPFDRAWPIIEDVGAALAYAHDHSVIHGDLKPANVFVTTSGKAKLFDFGIARAARGTRWGKDTAALAALTPAYASCEMLEYILPDTRDDIYSFACVIYEVLSGTRPFGDRNAVQARDAGEKPTPISALTDRQNAALARGLAFDRAARSSTVEMLLAGLAPKLDPGKRLVLTPGVVVLAVVSALTIAYFVADKFWLAKHITSEQVTTAATNIVSDKSIAVLPFTDMSERKDQEYFGDGMAEEILDLLAKIPGLKVIGRTSSFQFKGRDVDLRTIGTQLNAAHVLEGSVRKSGDQLRITAQLINTRTGTHEWSETYDRHLDDVLKLQDAIAAAVVRELQLTVAPAYMNERLTVRNTDAYDLMLRGRHAADRWDRDGLDKAVTLLKQSLDRDPTSADAAAELAVTYYKQAADNFVLPVIAFEQARVAVNTALKLDPGSARAHYVLGKIHVVYDWDWAAAERELDKVAALAPGSADAPAGKARLAFTLGHWEEGLTQIRAALALDPLDANTVDALSLIQWGRGNLADAEYAARRVLDIRPTYTWGHYYLSRILLARGDRDAALHEALLEPTDTNGVQQSGLAMVYSALGRKADSDAAIAALIKDHADRCAFVIAVAYAMRGESDEAVNWLERAYAQKDPGLIYLKVELPQQGRLLGPRFKTFLRKMNLPD